MNLIDSNDILKASKLNRFGGNLGRKPGGEAGDVYHAAGIKSISCIPMYIAIIPKLFWNS